MTNRTIAVLTSGRQDWGILRSSCEAIRNEPGLALDLLIGGMHLSSRHGRTVDLVHADGFAQAEKLDWLDQPAEDGGDPPAHIQAARALELVGTTLHRRCPAAIVLAGDRLETAAAAIAATIERTPIVHLHGGEQTEGAFDDALRHAITKLSHLHLVSHAAHARRVMAIGEDPATVHVVGAPSLDAAFRSDLADRAELEEALGLPLRPPVVIVTVHPATLDADPGAAAEPIIRAMDRVPATYVITLPNVDPGADRVRADLLTAAAAPGRVAVEALGERRYWGLMRIADAMLGNSSSGIVEAPGVDLPAVNVGERQAGRRREANVLDVGEDADQIAAAIRRALEPATRARIVAAHPQQIDGQVGRRIAGIIAAWHPPIPPRKPPIRVSE
jgi:UDP-hydrolysing UDP-N-acetyl-D-glucosamine 2-epimerase